MTTPATAPRPCGWPAPAPVGCAAWDSATADTQTWAGDVATSLLWALSGRRLGVCSTVAWPEVARSCGSTYYGPVRAWPYPHLPAYAAPYAGPYGCSCAGLCASTVVSLPGPVVDVTEVLVDDTGVPLAPSAWRVDGSRLVRVDGQAWPTGDRQLQVTYDRGVPLDGAAVNALNTYACELVKSRAGDRSCRLPQRIQSLTREGVTVAFADPQEYLDAGRVGVPEVDVWLASVNPHKLAEPSAVYTPGRRR